MKIEVGKKYITASGKIEQIILKSNDYTHPYCDTNNNSYNEDGQCLQYGDEDDLICEIVPSIYTLYKSGIVDLRELILEHIEYYTKWKEFANLEKIYVILLDKYIYICYNILTITTSTVPKK